MDFISPKYQVVKSLAKGGMGEIFLVKDLTCDRIVALKKMRDEWAENTTMRKRFLREAKLASRLSHPSIIAIYSLDEEGGYYTMPYIEGDTLKSVLRSTKEKLKMGKEDPIGSSIPTLTRLFLNICSAIAYAHAQGILHRDLKPENVIVGKYGEVILLDWGLARLIGEQEDEKDNSFSRLDNAEQEITEPGKIPGTLLYMAPERALGKSSSIATDVYSLGIMLYQMLTLEFPFRRTSLKQFRKQYAKEEFLDPQEMAPMREISHHLCRIIKKCLAKDPKERYLSVVDLISDLERYINGVPEWIRAGELNALKKEDWLFQENVALSHHRALTPGLEKLEWGNLMVSKAFFPGNVKIETEFALKKESKGMGWLLCVPEIMAVEGIYGALGALTVWVSLDGVSILRSNSEVAKTEKMTLIPGRLYPLSIEFLHPHIHVSIDGLCVLSHTNHLSLPGRRMGLLLKDGRVRSSPLQIFLGGREILVSCLAIPEALSSKGYQEEALIEYRKIAESFPGREEGQQALFRAGLTLLEKGKKEKGRKKSKLFSMAIEEFEKLHRSPSAPLEYLGKALVYRAKQEVIEEEKCLELALRKFPTHPLCPQVIESLFSRLYETSQSDRESAYRFALIALTCLPDLFQTKMIAEILEESLEIPPFFTPTLRSPKKLAIQLAFWLSKPAILREMKEKRKGEDGLFDIQIALYLLEKANHKLPESKTEEEEVAFSFARFFAFLDKKQKGEFKEHPSDCKPVKIWDALLKKKWNIAKELLKELPMEVRKDEKSLYCFLWGAFLAHEKGEKGAVSHLIESTSQVLYPPLASLFSHYLVDKKSFKKRWFCRAFSWEKKLFLFQYQLFYSCLGKAGRIWLC